MSTLGVAPTLAAGTAVIAINNPTGNTFADVILRAFCSLICGATATPVLPVWNYIPNPTGITAPGSSAAVDVTLRGPGSTMKTFVNAALTGSATSTFLRPFLRPFMGSFNDPRHAGTTSVTPAGVLIAETDGSIIVPPGVCLIGNTSPAYPFLGSPLLSFFQFSIATLNVVFPRCLADP